MKQPDIEEQDFSYGAAEDASGLQARVAIFGDNVSSRCEIGEDLRGAGFRTIDGGKITNLLEGPITLLGDVVMVDCPSLDGETRAALTRLDMRVARSGVQLIVSTSIEALDDVFAALDQCAPAILVDPSRADRIVAVGRTLTSISDPRLREMTDDDRLNLLHLSRQVDAIAHELDRLSGHRNLTAKDSKDRLSDFKQEFRAAPANQILNSGPESGQSSWPQPDPRLVRQLISARHARAKFFDRELFADPAWDMLLDLTAAQAEKQQVSVTSLCIAAEVPATTALRWIKQLVETGVFLRVSDPTDRRRAFIALSEQSSDAMARYFAEVEMPLLQQAA